MPAVKRKYSLKAELDAAEVLASFLLDGLADQTAKHSFQAAEQSSPKSVKRAKREPKDGEKKIKKKGCIHGRIKSHCRECGGSGICQHNRRRDRCKECGGNSICQHNRIRYTCKQCGGGSICEHQKIRNACRECGAASICLHGRQRSKCKDCGGTGICQHQRRRNQCKDCGGIAMCQHSRQRGRCTECGGGSICQHKLLRSACKDCSDGSICEHQRKRTLCEECCVSSICERKRTLSDCQCKHGKQRHQCLVCSKASSPVVEGHSPPAAGKLTPTPQTAPTISYPPLSPVQLPTSQISPAVGDFDSSSHVSPTTAVFATNSTSPTLVPTLTSTSTTPELAAQLPTDPTPVFVGAGVTTALFDQTYAPAGLLSYTNTGGAALAPATSTLNPMLSSPYSTVNLSSSTAFLASATNCNSLPLSAKTLSLPTPNFQTHLTAGLNTAAASSLTNPSSFLPSFCPNFLLQHMACEMLTTEDYFAGSFGAVNSGPISSTAPAEGNLAQLAMPIGDNCMV